MKNIQIIHNSRTGNSEKLSNIIADGLKDKFKVKVDSIKSLNPEQLAKDNPDTLIIGGRIIAMNTDRKMTKFVKKLDSYFEGQIPKIATFYTHEMSWKERFSKGLRKAFDNSACIGDACSEFLEIRLDKKKDSISEGQEAIQNYINMLIDFIGE